MVEDPGPIFTRQKIKLGLETNALVTLSVTFSSLLILGHLSLFLYILGLARSEFDDFGSGVAQLLGYLVLAIFVGYLILLAIRTVSISRGTVHWYWNKWAPPHKIDDEPANVDAFLSIPPGGFQENIDEEQMKIAFKKNLLRGIFLYIVGSIFSAWAVNNRRLVESAFDGDSKISVMVEMISFIFEVPIELIDILNLNISTSPIDSAILITVIGIPSLFFTVAISNFNELIERILYIGFMKLCDRNIDEITFVETLSISLSILSTAFIIGLILGQ